MNSVPTSPLEDSEKDEGDFTPTHWAFLKPALGWSQYQDVNPVPTNPLADDLTTAPSGPLNPLYLCSG